MNKVDNEIFNTAYRNKEYKSVLQKAVRRFKLNIPHDDLCRCKLMALWKALQRFDPNRKTRFTSYLYRKTVWECLDYLAAVKRDRHVRHDNIYNITKTPKYNRFEVMIEGLSQEYQNIMRQKFVDQMTLHEIGRANGYSYETARQKIAKAIKCLQYEENTK